MGFDPNTFTANLIQGLGQSINQGRQLLQDRQILDQVLPQLQQAQNPEDILRNLIPLQLNPDLSPQARQSAVQAASPALELAKTKQKSQKELQEQAATAKELAQRTGRPVEEFLNQPLSVLKTQLSALVAGEATSGREQAKSNQKFADEVRASSKKAEKRLGVTAELASLGARNETGPASLRRFFGLIGAPDIGETPTQGAISAARTFLLDFVKETFGGRLNQTEVNLIEKAIPDVNDKPEVFKAKLAVWQKFLEEASKGGKIINEIIKENGGRLPSDKDIQFLYDEKVSESKNELFSTINTLDQAELNEPDQTQGRLTPEQREALIRELAK